MTGGASKRFSSVVVIFIAAGLAGSLLAQSTTAPELHETGIPVLKDVAEQTKLTDADKLERKTLRQMLDSPDWPKRALAAMRLQRFSCNETQSMLIDLLDDSVWQVRVFAVRTLARRGITQQPDWFIDESEPRVLRAALRCRYSIEPTRLERGVRYLCRSSRLSEKLLGAELAAASGNDDLTKLARDTTRKIILNMNRAEAGTFSPRLSGLTGAPNYLRHTRWQRWLMKIGRRFEIRPGFLIPESKSQLVSDAIVIMPTEALADLDQYMDKLSDRRIDLAICLDCTASMSSELAAAQGSLDAMMLFIGDMVGTLRVALIAYRDRRDEFETRAWDFTTSIDATRRHLWQLSADGGGDGPEAVYRAMKLACSQLSWNIEHDKILIVVGDAPPHVGTGSRCVQLVEHAAKRGLTTHTIQAENKPVKHFDTIAKAGGGKCISLEDDETLIIEITGLTLGDRFEDELREFFELYLTLCR